MTITIRPVTGLPEIRAGDDLASMLAEALGPLAPKNGDVLVVTQKIVSKAEGAFRPAADEAAYRQIVEEEAKAILRRRGPLAITLTKHGFICANSGVDRSNVEGEQVVLLPADPDRSAHRIRIRVERGLGVSLAVIITDTFGRAWRRGLVDVAIGVSGMLPILDLRGSVDMHGRVLEVTEVAIADEIAAAAELVTGKASGVPAALVSGYSYPAGEGRATDLIRPPAEDMFR
ncbi:MAG TPA: coenzyme F420-0:L-glutamate ligase [Acidimicrobiia bacterium]|nr:coenzyme F420-0:L-glutamate ligase [Acidimicrobiia bacterium]